MNPISKRDFLKRLGELERQLASGSDNPGSWRCTDCERCSGGMFCESCADCHKCTYCADCTRCSNCTHCADSADLHHCAYCVHSSRCTGSQYLVYCRDCAECTFCFGCVGLQGREFHILNEPYDRKTYFEQIARLKKELGLRQGSGT